MQKATAVIQAARRYIEKNWSLLPIDVKTKKPLYENGEQQGLDHATQDIDVVKRWLKLHPDLALGGTPPPGTSIVDIDIYKNFYLDEVILEPLVKELSAQHGPVQRTQHGGFHFLVKGVVPPARILRRHFGSKFIDVKPHARGYVALHPATGYEWEQPYTNTPPALPPHWINGFDFTPAATSDSIQFKDLQNWKQERHKVRAALATLDPDAAYDEWIAVGQALHSIDPDKDGPAYKAWDSWSSRGEKYKNQADIDYHWQSFNQGGGVKAGTLYDMATQEDPKWRKKRQPRERGVIDTADTQSFDIGELAKTDKREIEIYIEGLLSQGSHLMIALYKFGKTFMALQLAAAFNSGKDFLGMKVKKKRKVALLALEEGGMSDEDPLPPSQRLTTRIRKMDLVEDITGVRVFFDIRGDPVDFVAKLIEEYDVVIIDSLAKLKQITQELGGGGGVWQDDYDIIDTYRGPVQRAGKLLITLTHGSKIGNTTDPESAINSTGGTLSAADGFFVLQRPVKDNNERVRLTPLGRDAANLQLELRFHPISLTWQSIGPWVHMTPTGAHIFQVLSEQRRHVALPYNEIATLAGTTGQVVMNECSHCLRKAGLIDTTGRRRNEETRAFEGQARVKLSRAGWKRHETLQEYELARERVVRQKEIEHDFGRIWN